MIEIVKDEFAALEFKRLKFTVKGIFAKADSPNSSGIIYSRAVWAKEIKKLMDRRTG